jgi:hypothetical protein
MSATLQEPKINVHKAVKSAIAFFEKSFAAQRTNNLQLEEVELSEDGCFWLITLGYDDPAAMTRPSLSDMIMPGAASFRPRPLRKYKVVRVNAENGKTVAVKNRE